MMYTVKHYRERNVNYAIWVLKLLFGLMMINHYIVSTSIKPDEGISIPTDVTDVAVNGKLAVRRTVELCAVDELALERWAARNALCKTFADRPL